MTDLAGAHVFAGFTESHGHLVGYGAALEQVDLRDTENLDEVVARVRAAAAKLPAGAWVLGRGWDQNLWPGQRFPTNEKLSAAVPDHPVLLRRVDGHAALANARALGAAGITPSTEDPPGGRFLRDAAGRLTGVADRFGGGAARARRARPDRRGHRAARSRCRASPGGVRRHRDPRRRGAAGRTRRAARARQRRGGCRCACTRCSTAATTRCWTRSSPPDRRSAGTGCSPCGPSSCSRTALSARAAPCCRRRTPTSPRRAVWRSPPRRASPTSCGAPARRGSSRASTRSATPR